MRKKKVDVSCEEQTGVLTADKIQLDENWCDFVFLKYNQKNKKVLVCRWTRQYFCSDFWSGFMSEASVPFSFELHWWELANMYVEYSECQSQGVANAAPS